MSLRVWAWYFEAIATDLAVRGLWVVIGESEGALVDEMGRQGRQGNGKRFSEMLWEEV